MDKVGHQPVFQGLGIHQGEQDKIPGLKEFRMLPPGLYQWQVQQCCFMAGGQGILPGKDLELDVRG